jgi:hypothetical protein
VFDAVFAVPNGTFLRDKRNGALHACGGNLDRQLGLTPSVVADRYEYEPFPVSCDVINGHLGRRAPNSVVVKVVGGQDFTVFMTDDGECRNNSSD